MQLKLHNQSICCINKPIMEEQFALLKEENFQLKNQISQLKNAFDLNRDILKIVSEQAKHQNPRIQMLYQIINRLTSINNQIMINTAELIHQKNIHKFQKQTVKRQNDLLKQRIEQMQQKQELIAKSIKLNELSVYFKGKMSQMEDQMKALEQERIIRQHEIQFFKKKLQYYEGQEKKISIIPTIDKNNPQKKFIEPPPSTLVPPLQQARKHLTNSETKLEMKLQIMNQEMRKIKIYCEQLEYRLNTMIKVYDLEEDIKKKQKQSIKKQHRKCLEDEYSHQMIEVKLLKFALNNLLKAQQSEGPDLMFTITNRNILRLRENNTQNGARTRQRYLYKSVEKQDKVKMRPKFDETQTQDQDHA